MQTVGSGHIYACGDAADSCGLLLTPVARLEADAVIENILHKNCKKIHYPAIPSAVFTSPKLAQIGISSKEAAERPDLYQINKIDTTKWYTYRRTNEPTAQAKVILKKDTQQIAGASFLSEEADVMVNYIAFMMKAGLKASYLNDLLFAYTSPASDLSYMVKD
ncbi:NAD(P)/FAD-dependent oxidoreductase [Bacillus testis]|uniref:NAD(P)/FAD-dependent oxidoreductase n=1 Tax=Bacillus testis TaxID=1622072 RepID=UPI00067E9E15|nr:NAD(P)/FAD-dependent oxidoreductase [Bacillus testis]